MGAFQCTESRGHTYSDREAPLSTARFGTQTRPSSALLCLALLVTASCRGTDSDSGAVPTTLEEAQPSDVAKIMTVPVRSGTPLAPVPLWTRGRLAALDRKATSQSGLLHDYRASVSRGRMPSRGGFRDHWIAACCSGICTAHRCVLRQRQDEATGQRSIPADRGNDQQGKATQTATAPESKKARDVLTAIRGRTGDRVLPSAVADRFLVGAEGLARALRAGCAARRGRC